MIVRIFNEGQYELPDEALEQLHDLDAATEAAIQANDATRFRQLYPRLLDHIRQSGTPLNAADLRASDLMLPPPDSSLSEVAKEFHCHHLLPFDHPAADRAPAV